MTTTAVRPSAESLAAFRSAVRKFIAQNAPDVRAREGHRAPVDAAQEALLRSWFAALFDAGFVGADWPVEYGAGPISTPARSHRQRGDSARPGAAARRPGQSRRTRTTALRIAGTEADTAAPIRSSEHVWCQLLSEPDAGSDIAAVRCRGAQQADGSWELHGQKTWITDGHWADMGLALVRTDPSSSRHHGLSVFAVPSPRPVSRCALFAQSVTPSR